MIVVSEEVSCCRLAREQLRSPSHGRKVAEVAEMALGLTMTRAHVYWPTAARRAFAVLVQRALSLIVGDAVAQQEHLLNLRNNTPARDKLKNEIT